MVLTHKAHVYLNYNALSISWWATCAMKMRCCVLKMCECDGGCVGRRVLISRSLSFSVCFSSHSLRPWWRCFEDDGLTSSTATTKCLIMLIWKRPTDSEARRQRQQPIRRWQLNEWFTVIRFVRILKIECTSPCETIMRCVQFSSVRVLRGKCNLFLLWKKAEFFHFEGECVTVSCDRFLW